MYFESNIKTAIQHQKEALRTKYFNTVRLLGKMSTLEKMEYLAKNYSDADYKGLGWYSVLPAYCILWGDYATAWMMAYYPRILYAGHLTSYLKVSFMRRELEDTVPEEKEPFAFLYDDDDVERHFNKREQTIWEIYPWHFHYQPNWIPGNSRYNEWIIDRWKRAFYHTVRDIDVSPEARYETRREIKNAFLHYYAFDSTLNLLASYFRQERYEEADECLFRLKCMFSDGDAARKYLEDGKKHRHLAPLVNMYDCWFKARFSSDECVRKAFAWEAVYWWLEMGLRHLGVLHGPSYLRFPIMDDSVIQLKDFCQIIGEFRLLGEEQDEFLRHFKQWTRHASVSFYETMKNDPVVPIRFEERGLPGFDEYRAIVTRVTGQQLPTDE